MEKLEQVQSLLKQIGFDDDDLKKIGSEDVEDFTPFLEKAKSSFKSLLNVILYARKTPTGTALL